MTNKGEIDRQITAIKLKLLNRKLYRIIAAAF